MPTPVGPAPRDPNDPDFWDWGDDVGYSTNGGHDDSQLLADLARLRRRRNLVTLVVILVLVVAVLATSL